MLRVVWDSWTRDEIAAELCRARAGQCLRILDITLYRYLQMTNDTCN